MGNGTICSGLALHSGKEQDMANAKHRRPRGTWTPASARCCSSTIRRTCSIWFSSRIEGVIELNASTLATAARAFNIPVVLSTVGVEMGVNKPTIASLKAALPDVKDIDRSSMNAWEDAAFVAAVKATGRKRLVMGGIVTSVCLAFPAIDALADGYESRSSKTQWQTATGICMTPLFSGSPTPEPFRGRPAR